MPAGRSGPGFLVTRNFDAIYSYNGAESYGLAISILSDRLAGGRGGRAEWPTDDPGLNRAERRELMALLGRRGYDVGEPDGRIGQKTRDAIKDVGAPARHERDGGVLARRCWRRSGAQAEESSQHVREASSPPASTT